MDFINRAAFELLFFTYFLNFKMVNKKDVTLDEVNSGILIGIIIVVIIMAAIIIIILKNII